ncbi:MAG: hypothetical protein KBA75_01780 [Alphaproteobacteria bacterium]|nr:hypothetical protein [Alphaproteobacteria bacterium]
MASSQEQSRILRPNLARKREIVLAIAWRGLLYTLGLMIASFCLVYIFAGEAANFFLNPSLKLSSDQVATLYVGASITATILGWLLALNHALHIRYSHFRIVLLAEPRKTSWLKQLIHGTDKIRKRRR